MKKQLRLVMAQLNFLVGDIEGNANKIIDYTNIAKNDLEADLVIFPELALTGYPPEDLLFRPGLYERVALALNAIQETAEGIDIIVGHPLQEGSKRYNAASFITGKKITATYHKSCLPNHGVFDEVRYFHSGDTPLVLNYHGLSIGIMICEDLWHQEPLFRTVSAGAELVISINASPFDMYKHETRMNMLRARAQEANVPILYVNCIGGQDELVFDGGSLVLNEEGIIQQGGSFYQENLIPVDVTIKNNKVNIQLTSAPLPIMTDEERIYGALVLGVSDYIKKNNFPSAIVGLSGGIDSALTLAIAIDAIGSDKVEAILMPSRYTSEISNADALAQARVMGVKTSVIPIETAFTAYLESLKEEFAGLPNNITEENLQARCRGTLLMAISNKKGSIVLSTGNKSELSVGYCTLYGDMVGGFCVLKDIPKTWVYRLAEYRNKIGSVIPVRVLEREPSAELAPNQKDQDSLPPYPLLDKILELYIEKDFSYKHIVAEGYDPNIVKKVILLVDGSEYKRRQAPPGVRVSTKAFGRDRRYPITSGYNNYLRFKNISNNSAQD